MQNPYMKWQSTDLVVFACIIPAWLELIIACMGDGERLLSRYLIPKLQVNTAIFALCKNNCIGLTVFGYSLLLKRVDAQKELLLRYI